MVIDDIFKGLTWKNIYQLKHVHEGTIACIVGTLHVEPDTQVTSQQMEHFQMKHPDLFDHVIYDVAFYGKELGLRPDQQYRIALEIRDKFLRWDASVKLTKLLYLSDEQRNQLAKQYNTEID